MDKIKFMLSGAWSFLLPFVRVLMAEYGYLLIDLARKAVGLMTKESELSGSDKRKKAIELVKSELLTEGVKVSNSVIETAVDSAVLELKAKLGEKLEVEER